MGWGTVENADGRKVGYMVDGKCEHEGCGKEIDCGLAYACGGMHDDCGGQACAGYFCGEHLYSVDHEAMGYQEINGSLCEKCWRRAREDLADMVLAGDLKVIDPSVSAEAYQGTFPWALIQMKAGKKVTRPGSRWCFYIQEEPGDHQGFIVKKDNLQMVLFADFDQPNMLATDWHLYEGEEG